MESEFFLFHRENRDFADIIKIRRSLAGLSGDSFFERNKRFYNEYEPELDEATIFKDEDTSSQMLVDDEVEGETRTPTKKGKNKIVRRYRKRKPNKVKSGK